MRKNIFFFAVIILLLGSGIFLSIRQKKPVQSMPLPVETKTEGPLSSLCILVDAGHGGYDGGARAISGRWEKEYNLQMALCIRDALEREGARVVMTRTEDKAFADKKRPDLDKRLSMAQEAQADLLLCIHMNEYHDSRESGPQVFYRKENGEGRLLAGCIQEAMIQDLQPSRIRKAMHGNYYMLSLPIPSVLVECGFLSNPTEAEWLLDDAYQQKLARAVVRGMAEYIALQKE